MKHEIIFQRIESVLILGLALYLYQHLEYNWVSFTLLLFTVDIFMIGYLHSKRTGALIYNLGHTYLIPAVLAIVGVSTENATIIGLALIWTSHIALDRMLGYGLKKETGFKHTHLGDL